MKTRFLQRHWQKLLVFFFGAVLLAVMLFVAFRVPQPSPTQWFVFRVTVALAAAGIVAMIPGLFSLHVTSGLRAGGAIAVFVLLYVWNPPELLTGSPPSSVIQQSTSGTGSPAVVSGGDVVIDDSRKGEGQTSRKE
jgi:hypothetical protein